MPPWEALSEVHLSNAFGMNTRKLKHSLSDPRGFRRWLRVLSPLKKFSWSILMLSEIAFTKVHICRVFFMIGLREGINSPKTHGYVLWRAWRGV